MTSYGYQITRDFFAAVQDDIAFLSDADPANDAEAVSHLQQVFSASWESAPNSSSAQERIQCELVQAYRELRRRYTALPPLSPLFHYQSTEREVTLHLGDKEATVGGGNSAAVAEQAASFPEEGLGEIVYLLKPRLSSLVQSDPEYITDEKTIHPESENEPFAIHPDESSEGDFRQRKTRFMLGFAARAGLPGIKLPKIENKEPPIRHTEQQGQSSSSSPLWEFVDFNPDVPQALPTKIAVDLDFNSVNWIHPDNLRAIGDDPKHFLRPTRILIAPASYQAPLPADEIARSQWARDAGVPPDEIGNYFQEILGPGNGAVPPVFLPVNESYRIIIQAGERIDESDPYDNFNVTLAVPEGYILEKGE